MGPARLLKLALLAQAVGKFAELPGGGKVGSLGLGPGGPLRKEALCLRVILEQRQQGYGVSWNPKKIPLFVILYQFLRYF